jgi:hypothetical protein
MKRAVAVFLESKKGLLNQFFGLYASWRYIDSADTDLVVFGPKDALDLVPDDCIKIECNAISNAHPWTSPRLPSAYHFINSIYFLCIPEAEFLLGYDYVLKTDVDTFLTCKWNDYFPLGYATGRGRYVYDTQTGDRIRQISTALGLTHHGIHNLGATHYGKPDKVLEVMKLTYTTSSYILDNVFDQDLGKWPGLYYGVTTMYAGEIAVNHLVSDLIQAPEKMDCRSDLNELIDQHVHIHSAHTDLMFSKFKFDKGDYADVDIAGLNKDIVASYCLSMALRGATLRAP